MSATLEHAALAIAAMVFNSLWQGALIVGAVWLGLRCLPSVGAATRYAIWLCALAALVMTPVLTIQIAEQRSEPVIEAVATTTSSSVSIAPDPKSSTSTPRAVFKPASATSEPGPSVPRKPHIAIPQSLAGAAALVWILVTCARGILLLLDVRALAAIRREGSLWSTAHDYPVLLSDRVQLPCATGFVRAAIILPASLVGRLRADDLEAIVVHELAHLRRYDVWTNALARIAEALVALNPAAWFVMRRLSTEREIACDDWVVARTGAGDAFARTLAALASGVGARAPIAAPNALASRHSLVVRIERLLDSRPRRLRLSPSALGGALMLLALIAFTVQSVAPVLAYEQPQLHDLARNSASRPIATTCAEPNRNIRILAFSGVRFRIPGSSRYGSGLADARTVQKEFGAAHSATFDLTVDAAGHPIKVSVLSAPQYPGMVQHITHTLMGHAYAPALRGCVPVTATIRTGAFLGSLHAGAYSIVVPSYPNGWSSQYASACKVPTLQHGGVPAFPDAMRTISLDSTYHASVRVHVDAAGAVTSAAVVTSSGQRAFDEALLAAARQATYPLTGSAGFKQARPSGAPPSWNAEHGSGTYVNCKPLPTEYLWNTTFERTITLGIVDAGAAGAIVRGRSGVR